MIKEACVETLSECLLAERRGANRLELCADLQFEGLTPSKELITEVLTKVNIPIKVMIRPREGDFVYSDEEINKMENAINFCKDAGVFGVVFGALTKDNKLDIDLISYLSDLAKPLNVTIHRAIDKVTNPLEDIEKLINISGINAILSSGTGSTAMEGSDLLRSMVELAGERIEVIVAGSVTNENIHRLHQLTQAREYHGRRIVG